jgi:arsenate reductase (glutaredoxin)
MIKVYGIPNCDTVKKARAWLDANGIAYAFHDYKKAGVPAVRLAAWCNSEGFERVLNRAGTTFRKLPDADKAGLDQARALALMTSHPSAIKRPVVEHAQGILIGFDADTWAKQLL